MQSLTNVTTAFDAAREGLRRELSITQQLIQDIYSLFPLVNTGKRRRPTRRWCVFACWSVAYDSDVQLLKAFAENASHFNADNFVKVQTALSSMASYSTITNEKFKTLKLIMERQQQNDLIRDRSVLSMQHYNSLLTTVLLPNMMHIMSLRNSLLLLKSKIITYDILPAATSTLLLRQIQ